MHVGWLMQVSCTCAGGVVHMRWLMGELRGIMHPCWLIQVKCVG